MKDIDECLLKTHSCGSYTECQNTVGTYKCEDKDQAKETNEDQSQESSHSSSGYGSRWKFTKQSSGSDTSASDSSGSETSGSDSSGSKTYESDSTGSKTSGSKSSGSDSSGSTTSGSKSSESGSNNSGYHSSMGCSKTLVIKYFAHCRPVPTVSY